MNTTEINDFRSFIDKSTKIEVAKIELEKEGNDLSIMAIDKEDDALFVMQINDIKGFINSLIEML